MGRRKMMIHGAGAALAASAAVAAGSTASAAEPRSAGTASGSRLGPRARVLISNDLAGDVDGLFSTVHALLCGSTEVRGIIGTFAEGLIDYDPSLPGSGSGEAEQLARTILRLMNLDRRVPAFKGAEHALTDRKTPIRSAGARAIVAEAMRTDTDLPLYVTVGAALTEVASALLIEPAIASRMTVVWIGGGSYPDGGTGDTNFNEDPTAAQVVFNDSTVELWHVPADVYSHCQVSDAELRVKVGEYGAIGRWLYSRLSQARRVLDDTYSLNTGETWNLGDSPLVLLTALTGWGPSVRQRPFRYDKTESSPYDVRYAPLLNSDGSYTPRSEGRQIRVYRGIDTRMMFDDFFAKMRAYDG
ncbi:nucleoside hydrolase [Streptomyces sp. NPDC091294]|uniref:nucleoside hydrolase n=1 Tax=Streptomyces sp. NPDC091294 TaxID=3365992 RepID=UPI003809127B